MLKKLNLQQAGAILGEYTKPQVYATIEENLDKIPDLPEVLRPVLAYEFYRDGKNYRHCVCPNCGHEWEEERTYSYYYSRAPKPACPVCKQQGLREITRGFTLSSSVYQTLILEANKTQGYIAMLSFYPQYKYDLNGKDVAECLEAGNYDFLHGNYEKMTEPASYFLSIFIPDKGVRVHDCGEKLKNVNNADAINNIKRLFMSELLDCNVKDAMEIVRENGGNIANGLFRGMKEICETVEAKKEAASRTREKKPNVELEMYLKYEPKDYDIDKLEELARVPLVLLKSEIGNKRTYLRYCKECREVSVGSYENGEFVCECCGAINNTGHSYYSYRGEETTEDVRVELFEVMEGTQDLLIRIINIKQKLTLDYTTSFEFMETHRFFFNPKKMMLFTNENGTFKKGTVYDLDCGRYNQAVVVQSDEEIKDVILNSSMKYSGLVEAWGLAENQPINQPGCCNRESYLYAWYKKPCMEQLLKTGLYTATKDILRMDMDAARMYVEPTEKSVYTILKITKPVFKIARSLNLGCRDIAYLNKLWEFDHTITEATFTAIRSISGGAIDAIYDIASRYNIPFAKIIEYIDSCYNNQCIQRNEAIRLWADYLRMAKDMTYRLDNKNTKFPPSLKKEHDRATFAYRVVQDEMNQKRFKEQAKENKRYEYSYEKLFVKVPQTPEEIIEEGTNQKHCVASYVNRVREGDTVVAFIRYKETPNDSYFTIEIKDDVIVQVRGYTNCAPTDKKLLEFLDKFAKAKNLRLHY